MYVVLIILTLICAVLLICVVLVQKSKGGGLSSSFAGSNQIMGVRRTNSFIEKLTWALAGAICLLAILSTFCMPKAINANSSRVNAPLLPHPLLPSRLPHLKHLPQMLPLITVAKLPAKKPDF